MKETRPKIAITMGDAAGIGPEIVVKALTRNEIYEKCIPIVIGDCEPIKEAIIFAGIELEIREINCVDEAEGIFGTIEILNLGYLQKGTWEYKKINARTGNAAYQYVVKSIRMAMEGLIDAIVTGPINKEALNAAGHHFSGHTEIFAYYTRSKNYAMLLVSKELKVIHCTTHVSMRQACDKVTMDRVYNVIKLADQAMRLMGVKEPKIGVAGLNAHCSEGGMFGDEEDKWILPAVCKAKEEGYQVEGPISPDTIFVKALAKQYDIVVAMYHDQGHIPIKLCGFRLNLETNQYESMSGVNVTVGLPVIRTSVDHGTAFGKAGEGRANGQSMVEAIQLAVTMSVKKMENIRCCKD